MPKKDRQRLHDQIRETAKQLTEEEEHLTASQLGEELRRSGIDPEKLKQKFYEVAREIAERERAAGRPAPSYLQQAIDQFSPDDVMPHDEKAAVSKMQRWIQKLSDSFSLPEQFESQRAYRKSGEVSEEEKTDLNDLEQQLKDEIQKENDRDG